MKKKRKKSEVKIKRENIYIYMVGFKLYLI